MKPKYIFYFHDNYVQFATKSKIKTYQFPLDCLMYGKVINIEKFIKQLKLFFKKEKLNTLLSPYIKIIIPYNFYQTDKEIVTMCFNSLGINKIDYTSEINYYPKQKNTTILNIHETYLIKTTTKNNNVKCLLYPFNLFKDKNELLNIVFNNENEKSVLMFGTNKNVPIFIDITKKLNLQQIHYYSNYQTYIIEKALK